MDKMITLIDQEFSRSLSKPIWGFFGMEKWFKGGDGYEPSYKRIYKFNIFII